MPLVAPTTLLIHCKKVSIQISLRMSVRDTQTDAGGTRCTKAPVNLLVTNSRYNTDVGEPCRQDSPHANLP